MEPLNGRIAIVTGGAGGIGRGIAQVLGREGATVILADVDGASGERTVRELRDDGAQAEAVELDVADRAAVDRAIDGVAAAHGRIDVMCANAGVFPPARVEEIDDAGWDAVLGVNVRGAVNCVQAALRHMRPAGYGRVVLTSSITGPMTGYPGWSQYAASKAAMVGFMRTAAIEVAREGITINAVLPGNIRTGAAHGPGEEYLQQMAAAVPVGYLGTPEDVGWAVRFLVSPEARYVTGHTLVADGGQLLPESSDVLREIAALDR
jgi:3-oxoacyl-[acyl-carrier protein] reductase